MMADIQWGSVLSDSQMSSLGLPKSTRYQAWDKLLGWSTEDICLPTLPEGLYRLPADHPAYIMLKANEGREVPFDRLHRGIGKAPDDWDKRAGRDAVLLRDGRISHAITDNHWLHLSSHPQNDIIAYTAKPDDCPACEPTPCYCATMAQDPNEPQPEIVTLTKMNEAEGQQLARLLSMENWRAVFVAFEKLGLIKIALTPEQIASTMLAALEGLDEGILERALNSASGMPEWEAVSAKVKAARDAIVLAKGGVA